MSADARPLEGPDLERAVTERFKRFNERWVILFKDIDTGIRFVLLDTKQDPVAKVPKRIIRHFAGRKVAEHALFRARMVAEWIGYDAVVIRYEALKEFEDSHQRMHWRYTRAVRFFGSRAQINWVAGLTMGEGVSFDESRGLHLPTAALRGLGPQ